MERLKPSTYVAIASALSSALTIYPCQIRVYQTLTVWTPTSYSWEEGVVAGHSGQFTPTLHTCQL